ncbi:metallophosphoesterase [Hellea sp.]|nr:metallophosphoesterase [Hellea sp.]
MSCLIKVSLVPIIIALLCLLYGFLIEPKMLKIRQISVTPENYQGQTLRVALLSDIHIGGAHVSVERVEKIVARVNELKPDIIVMPGDFIDGHLKRQEHSEAFNTAIEIGLSKLAFLEAPMGVFASIGNHDVWYDADFVSRALTRAGVSVLRNQALNVSGNICIVGLADHDTQSENRGAFNACEDNAYPIAIMHSPDSFDYLRSDVVLAVAGHTHGGQINIPLIGRRVTSTRAGKKWAYGRIDVGGVPVFVTSGIGTSILPARFRAPPEIVLIELSPQ